MEILTGLQQYLQAESLRSINEISVYILLFAFIYIKSGFLIGVVLPGGNSLLLTAGILAYQNILNLNIVIISVVSATILGDLTGYFFGRKVGRKLFNKEKSLLFHKDYLIKAESFYEKHGSITIFIAKFLPVIRTFAPVVAGIGKMQLTKFILYSVLGSLTWGGGMSILGYILGSSIPNIDDNLNLVILAVFVATLIPPVLHMLIDKQHRAQLMRLLRVR